MGGLLDTFAGAIMVLVPMILSLTVHEFAHAAAAKALGDDTAERMGRPPVVWSRSGGSRRPVRLGETDPKTPHG